MLNWEGHPNRCPCKGKGFAFFDSLQPEICPIHNEKDSTIFYRNSYKAVRDELIEHHDLSKKEIRKRVDLLMEGLEPSPENFLEAVFEVLETEENRDDYQEPDPLELDFIRGTF